MKTKLLLIAGLALAISAPLARAQDEGERREYMHELRRDCESGDDGACERLRHMRHEGYEERERGGYQGERGGGAPPPVADPRVALCAAIENNYNNCLKHQHDGCPAWVIELKANHCF
ncbi:MAG: hypothetical protein WBQ53_06625 [Methylocystis sp.]